MKKRIKSAVALALALGLVVVAGKYTSDHALKASEEGGTEEYVEENTTSQEEGLALESGDDSTVVNDTTGEVTTTDGEGNTEVTNPDETTASDGTEVADGEKAKEDADAEKTDEELLDGQTEESEDKEAVECDGHVDEDEDGICDKCGSEIEATEEEEKECKEHEDSDGDGLCDNCGTEIEHVDKDEDGYCDNCGEKLKDKRPEGTVSISVDKDVSQPLPAGTKITLTAVTEGFDDYPHHFEWYRSKDGENWEMMANASGSKYTFTLTEETSGYRWRVRVIAEDQTTTWP